MFSAPQKEEEPVSENICFRIKYTVSVKTKKKPDLK
jgi:hypothetical protein